MGQEDNMQKDLPGLSKKSFSMFFGGGEIWFEHLDGIYEHTDLPSKSWKAIQSCSNVLRGHHLLQ